ncbi:MAG: type II toxin-antitoxin system VapC family toxin [Planctomycetota bacterium]|nr:type II toxin-antitoxin system VapC family toxin [Planctomycetota bacterium]MDA1137098.1 type II toxin-antitoxin system VapC family toxin [Planctomycetota bacterium]
MTRYLLDSGIVSDMVNRRFGVYEKALEAFQRGDVLGIGTPVWGELIAGIENCSSRDKNHSKLKHGVRRLRIWPLDKTSAEKFGRLFAELRRMGRPMQQIDIQIAAIALTLGNCVVVSKDSDLHAVPGLKVEDWST